MVMKRILLTGGTGFVGSYLTEYLRAHEPEANLVVVGQATAPSNDPKIEIVAADLTQSDKVDELIKKYQPDQIYHLASIAHVSVGWREPARLLHNNFELTLNLLESVRLYAPKAQILLVSSADLYDHDDPAPIDEKRAIKPLNPYAVSKATQDMLGQAYAASFGLSVVIVRPFNHIGPRQRPGFVVADFASSIARAEYDQEQRVMKVGNLEAARDFTDVRDMVAAYYLLMNQGKVGDIYNAGTGDGVKIQTILDKLVAAAKVPIEIVSDPSKFRPVDYPQVICDASKLRALGWKPQYSLEQTLTDILGYWRETVAPEYKKG